MKKSLPLLGLAALLAAPFCVQAQNSESVYQKREVIIVDEDQPRVVDQRREVIVRDDPNPFYGNNHTVFRNNRRRDYRYDGLSFFSTLSLGYNGLVEDLDRLELPADADYLDLKTRSINFKLMLVDYNLNFARWIGLRTGLELEVANFMFEKNITLQQNELGYVEPNYYYEDHGIHLRKSKLVSSYLNVPLVLRLNVGRTTEIYGGVVGGWRWNSYQKIRSKQFGKERLRKDLGLRNFHYGYTAGIIFDHVGVYATYYPHSIFKTSTEHQVGDIRFRNPEARQVSVGISVRY